MGTEKRIIKNFDQLATSALRRQALVIAEAGFGAIDTKKAVEKNFIYDAKKQRLFIRNQELNIAKFKRIVCVGFGKAAELAGKNRQTESRRVGSLRDRLEQGIQKKIQGIRLNGDPKHRIFNTLNISFEGLDGETLLMNLDLIHLYVSTGSACTAGSVEPSHVLLAMGLPEKNARASIRFSLGRFTTQKEIDYALEQMPGVVERLRKVSVEKRVG